MTVRSLAAGTILGALVLVGCLNAGTGSGARALTKSYKATKIQGVYNTAVRMSSVRCAVDTGAAKSNGVCLRVTRPRVAGSTPLADYNILCAAETDHGGGGSAKKSGVRLGDSAFGAGKNPGDFRVDDGYAYVAAQGEAGFTGYIANPVGDPDTVWWWPVVVSRRIVVGVPSTTFIVRNMPDDNNVVQLFLIEGDLLMAENLDNSTETGQLSDKACFLAATIASGSVTFKKWKLDSHDAEYDTILDPHERQRAKARADDAKRFRDAAGEKYNNLRDP